MEGTGIRQPKGSTVRKKTPRLVVSDALARITSLPGLLWYGIAAVVLLVIIIGSIILTQITNPPMTPTSTPNLVMGDQIYRP